jgi:hypothetical protein
MLFMPECRPASVGRRRWAVEAVTRPKRTSMCEGIEGMSIRPSMALKNDASVLVPSCRTYLLDSMNFSMLLMGFDARVPLTVKG